MDYGQPVTSPNQEQEPPFSFTPTGDGEKLENSFNFSPDRDPRNVGSSAIISSGQETLPSQQSGTAEYPPQQINPEAVQTDYDQNQLGEVVNLEMPPGVIEPLSGVTQDTKETETIDISQIAREKDHISPKTVRAMEKAEADFKRGALSPAELVGIKQAATEAYMDTFGERANWKGKKAA